MQNVGLLRRLSAGVYELLSLIAIWLLITLLFEIVTAGLDIVLKRNLLQLVLWLATGVYLITCWVKTGQTLAAQAWKIKLVNTESSLLSVQQALLRYLLVTVSFIVFGVGFLWAVVDKDSLFLHDRLLKTRFVNAAKA